MTAFEDGAMSDLTLVILAAGMGSRYGGLKQLDGVGPNGEVIMEYSIHDAIKAGVNRVVFVIRKSFEKAFQESILARLPDRLDVRLAYQEFDDLPPDLPADVDPEKREKPWGTGHAVWTARESVKTPFMAINADDYYGPEAFAKLAGHLTSEERPRPCMVGFRLTNTLSPSGTVSRGVCEVENETLRQITERTELQLKEPNKVVDSDSGATYPEDTVVSMNCWGFSANFMDFLGERFHDYLQSISGQEKALRRGEFYLPAAVDEWRSEGRGEVKVLVSEESWLGVTYPEDKETVVKGIQQRVEAGFYPKNLWA